MIQKSYISGHFSILAVLFLISCGKYAPPRPPEVFSPNPVTVLEVSADISAVNFKWGSPDSDQTGSELRSMDGYTIYRKTIKEKSDVIDPEVPYESIAEIKDIHVEELKKLREKALEENKPARKVKIDDALKKFSYSDKTVQAGQQYAYRIVPVNQGDVEGRVDKIIKVLFRGDSSEIVMIDEAQLEVEEIE